MAETSAITIPNLPVLLRQINLIAHRQVPFMTSLAINTTASGARKAMVRQMHDAFTVRARRGFIDRSVRMRASNKRQRLIHAKLTIRDPFWIQHEKGGTRRPGDVTRSIVLRVNPKSRKGRAIRGVNTPKAVLAKFPETFARKSMFGRKVLIFRRLQKRRLRLLFVVEPFVRIRPTLGFRKTVGAHVRENYVREFRAAAAHAFRTTR